MPSAIDAASGRWPELLGALAGLSAEQLTDRHQPCPACGGEDRYRWDQDDGDGGWFCNQCGGKDHAGGGGNGMDLLTRVTGWDFKQACRQVERHLGISSTGSAPIPDPPTAGAEHVWRYTETYYVCRFPGKKIRPLTWAGTAWAWKSPAKPRPLYWARRAAAAPVLIAEGEKAADAAAQLFPDHAVCTWPGGTSNVQHADWSSMRGRTVTIWPDADDVGRKAAAQLASILHGLSCTVAVVNPSEKLPQGWDLADGLAEGMTPTQAASIVARFARAVELPAEPDPVPEPDPTPAAGSAAAQRPQLLTISDIEDRLREAITDGVGASGLAVLIAELVSASDQPSYTVQRLADAIRADQAQADAVGAEARQLAAEQDRIDLGQVLSPEYLLPQSIASAINTRSRYLPCEGPSAALPFLTAVAGLVKLGSEVEGCAVAGYRVPINLFACLVGRSGAKKSPIGRLLVEAPTADPRAELARANQREREAWEAACRETKRGESKPLPPSPKRLVVSDFTGEALAAQLQTQEAAGLGLLVNRDELSGLFGSMNAYRGGRGADEQQLLELFDGSGLSSLRIVGDRHYSRSQVSIWGSTQPDVLRQLVADGDASGLWARFLFVPLPERAIPLPMTTSPAEVAEVEAAAQTLADACNAVYRLPRQTCRLSPAAAAAFANYELGRQNAAMKATIGAQSALYGKSAGKVLRVAGVLHLLQIAAKELTVGAEITAATIERASSLVDHLDGWSLGLHAEVAGGAASQLMRTVHRVAELAAGPISWRELSIRLSSRQRKEIDSAAFREAAAALASAGFGEVQTGKRGAVSYKALRPLP